MPRPVEATARRLRDWLVGHALPLWSNAGFDAAHQRFEEQLGLAGRPALDVPHRLIVQTRQIHTYALVSRKGWYRDADAILKTAYAALIRDYRRPDGRPGWVFAVRRDGTPADARRDFYATAFVLLALGSYFGLTGDRAALGFADETLDFLDRHMTAPCGGGYVEALPVPDAPRRQNPHMHLFEALLNLWETTRERRYLDRASAIFGLFGRHFFRPERGGVLLEYFDDGLVPAAGETGRIVEPGHHCEWIWLLRWYERETGTDVQAYVDGLYGHVARHGRDRGGMLPDELLDDGTVRTPTRRLWPMTEAVKAHLLEARRGRPDALETAVSLADTMFERFLAPALPGGWIDRFDANGNPMGEVMPASSLYHVLGAVDELDRFVGSA